MYASFVPISCILLELAVETIIGTNLLSAFFSLILSDISTQTFATMSVNRLELSGTHVGLVDCPNPDKMEQSWECIFFMSLPI